MKKLILLAAVASLVFSSCKKDQENIPVQKVCTGPVVKFQHGSAWTWYEEDEKNNPLRLAIAMDDAAMNSLDTTDPNSEGHHHVNMMSLMLDTKALTATPFKYVGLDWNPHGHEPAGVYDLPHFDFHFYMANEADVAAATDPVKLTANVSPEFLPAHYVAGPPVPQMGLHWLDVTSPELNGQGFTQTFIYGSYNGKVTFYEPMITKAFILSNPSFERAIPQPAKVQQSGWYPTKIRLVKAPGVTNIILEGFVNRTQSL